MKNILASISILLIVGCSGKSNEIFSYGLADNKVAYTEPNSDLVAGEKHIIESWNIVKQTDKVPNVIGTEFGIAYKLNEFSNDEAITIEEIIIFPDGGLTNPDTGISTKIDTENLR
jgi:hypothetical protein